MVSLFVIFECRCALGHGMHVQAMTSGQRFSASPQTVSPAIQGFLPLSAICLQAHWDYRPKSLHRSSCLCKCFAHWDLLCPRMMICVESFYNQGTLNFSKPVSLPKVTLSTLFLRLRRLYLGDTKSPDPESCSQRQELKETGLVYLKYLVYEVFEKRFHRKQAAPMM